MRAAVIGLGVGAEHAVGYGHAGCEVALLCDRDQRRLAEVGERWPSAERTEDPVDVLDDPTIDVVSIASWDDAHGEQVLAALRTGKHVFVEKPLCLREDEADEIHGALAENPELRLSSNLPLRASPRFVRLRALVAGGELGSPYFAEASYDYGRLWKLTEGWRGQIPYYSVVLGGAVHLVDLLLWLTGGRVAEVSAAGNRIVTEGTRFEHDDLVAATLRFEDGMVAVVTANLGAAHPHFHHLRLFGTDGTFVNGVEAGTLHRGRGDEASAEQLSEEYPGAPKGALIPGFVEAIRSGSRPPVTEDEVFETMAVCFAIERARESGVPEPVRRLRS